MSKGNLFVQLNLCWRRIVKRASAPVILKLIFCLVAATATVIACGWMGTDQSVRFNTYQTEREMGRLPPLPTLASGLTEQRSYWISEDQWDDPDSVYGAGERRTREVDEIWNRAEAAEKAGELALTRSLLNEYLARTDLKRDTGFHPKDWQQRRNSSIDRLDALTASDRGASLSVVQAYLDARRAYDPGRGSGDVYSALSAVPANKHLVDNVAYLRAATAHRDANYSASARAFKELAARYPQSEKREAALFMSAVATMKTSRSFTGTSGDEAHVRANYRPGETRQTDSTSNEKEPAPLAECCDQGWHEARAAFKHFLGKYPRGRYSRDSRGWIAYLLLRGNDRAGALTEYYRLLGDDQDRNARLEAAFSLTLVRHHATDDEMKRVEEGLADEPQAALAYAYHEIYNYLINAGCPLRYDWPENSWEASQQEAQKRSHQHAGLERVAAFATRLMRRYPRASVGGSFALRVAGANLELGENRAALELTDRALSLGVKEQERARALWVKGVAEHRLGNHESAGRTLSTLVAENPQGEFTESARRLLAMVAEDAGDVDAALEHYLALGYETDVAYFIDVLMTPEQLVGFIEGHPKLEKRDEFLYALGVRFMRERQWEAARWTFARIHTSPQPNYNYYYDNPNTCYQQPIPGYRCYDPKDREHGPGVSARLVMSDLRTIDDMERLESAVEQAEEKGDEDEAEAEALYQLASYQYEASALVFYNPVAWQYGRYINLSYLESRGRYRAANESQTLWHYMQEHETLARALVIYLDIARRYPQTRAARDALYTAAVCHERLSDFNPYWRNIYEIGLHAGDRMVTYANVKATYPDYQLPRGTYGWQPSTRTVNDGPGWAAPPKPKPRPTFRERLKLEAGIFLNWIGRSWEETARHWAAVILAFLSALFASHLAGRTRKQLRNHFPTRRLPGTKRRQLYRWLAAWRRGGLRKLIRVESRMFIRRARRQALRLMLDARGRSLLMLNVATHALLVMLLVVMVNVMSG